MKKRTGDIHRQEFLNTFRHTSGFWLWPLSFLWLPRETFAFFWALEAYPLESTQKIQPLQRVAFALPYASSNALPSRGGTVVPYPYREGGR